MAEWVITDQEIEATEKLLLPDGAHFSDDARTVIRCWRSTDVAACPGSGKTTVLLAKLKLLGDRMPLENGAGICVLSHTNVAVDEIKTRLSSYADKLLRYPNFIGTIQSFVDRFVTMPYLRKIAGKSVQAVDDLTYAQHMLHKMQTSRRYVALEYVVKGNYGTGNQFTERLDHIRALYLNNDGALCIGKRKSPLAGADKRSARQYKELIKELMETDGIIKYRDAYTYADAAVNNLPEEYTNLFSARFRYVFIDEYQDCDETQRKALRTLFNSNKCIVIIVGDADQAIYNSVDKTVTDWIPTEGFLPIASSCRYGQEIADILGKLKRDKEHISTLTGKTNLKPILLVFDVEKIDRVIDGFVSALEARGLHDPNGIYKAIGAIKKEDSAGLKVGSYWSKFDGTRKRKVEYSYWALIDVICEELSTGKLYKAERTIRTLICRMLHYAEIRHPKTGKEYSVTSIKKNLDDDYYEIYRDQVFALTQLNDFERDAVNLYLRNLINQLLELMNFGKEDIFRSLPKHFAEAPVTEGRQASDNNIYIDPIRGRRIEFNTIHGVKGETHDATLYLETDRQGASDLKRILPYFGVDKAGASSLYDYSRKLAYVGMSRPRHLLCVAMRSKTYEKSKGVFDEDWEIMDLRKDAED